MGQQLPVTCRPLVAGFDDLSPYGALSSFEDKKINLLSVCVWGGLSHFETFIIIVIISSSSSSSSSSSKIVNSIVTTNLLLIWKSGTNYCHPAELPACISCTVLHVSFSVLHLFKSTVNALLITIIFDSVTTEF